MKKVLKFDIEVSPEVVYGYGTPYDFKVIGRKDRSRLLSFAHHLSGDKKIHCKTLADFPRFKEDPLDDYYLTKYAKEVMEKADIPIAYNGDKFDLKVMNNFFALHNLGPLRQTKSVDPLKTIRNKFKLFGNSLDSVAEYFGIERKKETRRGLGIACIDGPINERRKALKEMAEYNIQDVVVLNLVDEKVAPYSNNSPHIDPEMGTLICPNHNCGSSNIIKKGTEQFVSGRRQCFKCNDCGKRFMGKLEKPE